MSKETEQLKELAREDRKAEKEVKQPKDKHYSQQDGHAQRSIANDPHKNSKRR